MIEILLYLILIILTLRYCNVFQLHNANKWLIPFGFIVKLLVSCLFYFIYVYKIGPNQEPSDAVRFMEESKMLFDVYHISKSDYFSLLTGIGDNARMLHTYMSQAFIWDAGNFTMINDSRNTIRIHSLIQFISHNQIAIHFIILNFISLIGIQQLHLSFKKFTLINSSILFFILLLLPSLVFWSSSILKEPFLILGLGILIRGLLTDFKLSKKIFVITLGAFILIGFKPYILICLIPSILFYFSFKYIFNYQLAKTLIFLAIMTILPLSFFTFERQKLTEYISRKQFDLENVGEGGVHAYIGEYINNGYYYFKPDQYKNIKLIGDSVLLIKPSEAFFLSVDTKQLPKKVYIYPSGEKWKKHNLMPGTKSYFKSTLIDNSFQQLILNIPEALINAIFRPFPFDKGSILKIPTMLEAWGVFLFLILSFIFKKKNIQKKEVGIISSLLIFAILLFLLIGWTTPITGAIVRFRFPAQLALVIIGVIFIDYKRIKIKKHE